MEMRRTETVKYYTISMEEFKKLLGIVDSEKIRDIQRKYHVIGSPESLSVQITAEVST